MPDTIVRSTNGWIKRVSHHRMDGTEIGHLWKIGRLTLLPRQLRALLLLAAAVLVLGTGALFAKSTIGGTRTGGGTPRCFPMWCR